RLPISDAGAGDASVPTSGEGYAPAARLDQRESGESPPRSSNPPDGVRWYRREVPIPRRYTTDAIVLSRFDLGEADRVLTLITPGGGKLKGIAKGGRRPPCGRGGSRERFAELTGALARGRTFDVVTQVSVGHAWLNLRDSLESAATAWDLAGLAGRG